MSSILDSTLLNPPLLDNLAPELYGSFGFESLFPLAPTSNIPFQSPSSSSSDNDFSSPPTSPESPPPPSTSSPPLLKPEIDTAWVGSMDTTHLTEPQINPLLVTDYQLNPVPVNARKRRTNSNRKSARGGRGQAGRGTNGTRKKNVRASTTSPHPPQPAVIPTAPITPIAPLTPGTGKEDFGVLAASDGGVSIGPSQLRELMQESALKQKRLKRKAELARLSRKKKQAKMSDLEKQVALLREQNQRLASLNATLLAERGKMDGKDAKIHLKSQTPVPTSQYQSLEKAIGAINKLFLKAGSDVPMKQATLDETETSQLITAVSECFKENTSSLESSVKKIEQTLVPCTAMQFLEWALMQRDKFYQEENGLFMSLFRDEMGATSQQLAKLLALRTQLQQKSLKMKDQALLDAFRAFEKVLLERGRLQQPDAFEQLRTIFTPRQLATYFRYVSQYGAVLIKVPV